MLYRNLYTFWCKLWQNWYTLNNNWDIYSKSCEWEFIKSMIFTILIVIFMAVLYFNRERRK